jgi:signal transduction histidine kinase
MIRIGKQLGRYFTLVSLTSVLLITLLSNIGMNVFFSAYLRESEESEDQVIASYAGELLKDGGVLDAQDLMSMEHYAFTMKAEVILENIEGQVIMSTRKLSDPAEDLLDRTAYMDEDEFSYREYDYGMDGLSYGKILVGRPKSIFSTSEDRRFLIIINLIYLLAAAVSLMFGVVLRNRLKKKFLHPIYAIQDNAKLIEQGAYLSVREVGSETIELNELSASVTNMALRLEEQERLRKRLTSDIAHELRTPLATVNSHLEAFIDNIWEPTTERLTILQDEIRRLTNLIKDLGDLSYMESGEIKLSKSNFNLSESMMNLVDHFEPLFASDEKTITADVQSGILVHGDRDRLNQVFINIVSNALKYTNPGGQVIVSVRKDGASAEILVKDDGIGIPKEDLPYIFERFYRSDLSRSRGTGGKGIGLTIAKALIDAHGGTITILSETADGTMVRILLPALSEA